MNVFLLALIGPTALETNPLSLGFIDVVPFLSFSFFFFFLFLLLLPHPIHFIYIFSLYSTYLASLT